MFRLVLEPVMPGCARWLQRRPMWLLTVVGLVLVLLFFATNHIQRLSATSNFKRVHVDGCECFKWVKISQDDSHNGKATLKNNTCSEASYTRGYHQKVIAYTYFEPPVLDNNQTRKGDRQYLLGVSENLKLINKFYPGWIMRLYYQAERESASFKTLCRIACSEPDLDLCNAEEIPRIEQAEKLYPLIWRFLPIIDPQVDDFMSRDLDSRLNAREAAAVADFYKRPKMNLHVMRDHPAHNTYIMGGMWGVKLTNATFRDKVRQSFKKMLKDPVSFGKRKRDGFDQVALTTHIWPWAKWQALCHDSYLCKSYPRSEPFPTRREDVNGNYVGSVVTTGDGRIPFTSDYECPAKCRPKEHQDWIYC